MYAVIETGGKQYKVESGNVVYVEKLTAAENDTVTFQVIAVGDENGIKVGTPYVDVYKRQIDKFLYGNTIDRIRKG